MVGHTAQDFTTNDNYSTQVPERGESKTYETEQKRALGIVIPKIHILLHLYCANGKAPSQQAPRNLRPKPSYISSVRFISHGESNWHAVCCFKNILRFSSFRFSIGNSLSGKALGGGGGAYILWSVVKCLRLKIVYLLLRRQEFTVGSRCFDRVEIVVEA